MYIYIYIYIYNVRRGTDGVSTHGVTARFIVFDRGTFWVLRLTYCYIPKSARSYLFPQSVKIHSFCSGPISVDSICPQPGSALAQMQTRMAQHTQNKTITITATMIMTIMLTTTMMFTIMALYDIKAATAQAHTIYYIIHHIMIYVIQTTLSLSLYVYIYIYIYHNI